MVNRFNKHKMDKNIKKFEMCIMMVQITWVSISGKAGNILRIDPRLRSPPVVDDRRNVGVPSGFVGLDM